MLAFKQACSKKLIEKNLFFCYSGQINDVALTPHRNRDCNDLTNSRQNSRHQ